MSRILELRQRKADLFQEADALLAKMHAEDYAPSDEEREADERRANELEAQLARVSKAIEREEALMAHELQAQPVSGPETKPAAAGVEILRDQIEETGEFASAGEFFQAVVQAGTPGARLDSRIERLMAASGMNASTPSEGAILVPKQFAMNIWDRMSQDPLNLLSRCDNYTVVGDSLELPAVADSDRSGGTVFGGVKAYWLAEAGQMTGTKPKLRKVKLEPQELGALVYATNKLLRNAPALEQFIGRSAAAALSFAIGDAIINGDGAGKPLGILNADCLVAVPKEAGQAAGTIVAKNISKMWARLHPQAKANALWLINPEVSTALDELYLATGSSSGQLVYMPPGGFADRPYGTLKGRPVLECEWCEALGTVGDILLVDLSAYAVGQKGGVNAATSMHVKFETNETAFRFIFELDGQPWLDKAITPYKGSSTLSTFVALQTRA